MCACLVPPLTTCALSTVVEREDDDGGNQKVVRERHRLGEQRQADERHRQEVMGQFESGKNTTPAMAAGISDHVWTCEEIEALLD